MGRIGRDSARALLALACLGGCLTAVAYAARHAHAPEAGGAGRQARATRLPKPRILTHPGVRTLSSTARFTFSARLTGARFSCRLDSGGWQRCRSPVFFRKLATGGHSFGVRTVDRRSGRSQIAGFRWTRLEAKRFTILPDLSGLDALHPGAPPLALPLTVENPNSAPILVTDLRVAIPSDPTGCGSAENLALTPSSASATKPLVVPAGGSVRLPAKGVLPPAIQLRDLPVDQDACQGARFPLEFTGSAHG